MPRFAQVSNNVNMQIRFIVQELQFLHIPLMSPNGIKYLHIQRLFLKISCLYANCVGGRKENHKNTHKLWLKWIKKLFNCLIKNHCQGSTIDLSSFIQTKSNIQSNLTYNLPALLIHNKITVYIKKKFQIKQNYHNLSNYKYD